MRKLRAADAHDARVHCVKCQMPRTSDADDAGVHRS